MARMSGSVEEPIMQAWRKEGGMVAIRIGWNSEHFRPFHFSYFVERGERKERKEGKQAGGFGSL